MQMNDDDAVCSVPLQWTDLAAPDPEIEMGGRRALFRARDLMELTRLVGDLKRELRPRKRRDV